MKKWKFIGLKGISEDKQAILDCNSLKLKHKNIIKASQGYEWEVA